MFGALLDPEKGGHCRIRPVGTEYVTKQLYLPDTAMLITRFLAADGVGEVVDFMPPAGAMATAEHRLVRMVRCVRGELTFEVEVAPRFDYGRREHTLQLTAAGAVFTAGDAGLTLHAVRAPDDERVAEVRPVGRGPGGAAAAVGRADPRGGPGVGGRPAAGGPARGDRAGARRHRPVLAVLAGPVARTGAGGGRWCSARRSP